MGSMLTELMSSKDADLAQQQHLITGLQAHLRVFCQDVLHHMQVSRSVRMLHHKHVPAALDTSLLLHIVVKLVLCHMVVVQIAQVTLHTLHLHVGAVWCHQSSRQCINALPIMTRSHLWVEVNP